MLVGSRVLANARETAPACPSIVILTTASDQAVNNGITEDLVSAWKSRRPSGVSAYQFPKDEKVPHDFIDPSQPDQQTAVAYPKLIELLESPAGG